jgi:hypothetical protein
MKRVAWVLTAILASLLVSGCSNSTDPVDEGPEYLDYSTPDNVIDNFVTAWNEMDIAEYRDVILYAGDPLTREEDYYAEFKFYFIDYYSEGLLWNLEEEQTHTQALFSGEPNDTGITPGVESIDLRFNAAGVWSAPDNPLEIFGDEYPAGTLFRNYLTDAVLNLKGTIEGTDVNVLLIRDTVRFYVIPVEGGEYRLWKWVDIEQGFRATGDSSWGAIKALW